MKAPCPFQPRRPSPPRRAKKRKAGARSEGLRPLGIGPGMPPFGKRAPRSERHPPPFKGKAQGGPWPSLGDQIQKSGQASNGVAPPQQQTDVGYRRLRALASKIAGDHPQRGSPCSSQAGGKKKKKKKKWSATALLGHSQQFKRPLEETAPPADGFLRAAKNGRALPLAPAGSFACSQPRLVDTGGRRLREWRG